MSRSVERFSNRIANYVKYRPGYPGEILHFLEKKCGLTSASIIADLGSGTGKLTEIFVNYRNVVIGVEPNAGMRAVAEELFQNSPNFRSVDGTAEQTTLSPASVDLITAGQAFHWFNPKLARIEAARILKPGGWVALIWNDRKLQSTPFLKDYEALLLKYGTDYQEVRNDKATAAIEEFFAPGAVQLATFPNQQVFDFDGLRGRVLSSSYTPEPDHPNFDAMLRDLDQIFNRNKQSGHVTFDYDTKVYYGHLPTESNYE